MLIKEISQLKKIYRLQLKTIYFGGGTPSLLNYKQINQIIDLFDDSTFEEITLEINPVTITDKFVDNLKLTKVNRLSIGAQSFDDKELAYLSRLHDKNGIVKAYDILRGSGYNNISLDLIDLFV